MEFVSNVYLVDGLKVIQCNIRDITERALAVHALGASEARYRRLFETAQDGSSSSRNERKDHGRQSIPDRPARLSPTS